MNKLLKYILGAACLLTVGSVSAQQLPVMNHYIYNPYLYNPARTGQNDLGSINANFKKQWVNMPQSPITAALSIESPIPNTKIGDMGIGGMIYTEQMHIITRVGGMATYAYHIPFEKGKDYKHRLGAGISLGVIHQRFNFGAATALDDGDAQLLANAANGTSFDFSAGLDYHFRGLHVGGAMLQGLNNGLKFINPNDTTDIKFINTRHWLVTASYKFMFGPKEKKHRVYLEPVFLGRIIQGLPFQAEGNVVVGLDGIAWLGAGYRSSNTETATSAITVTAGVEIGRRVVAAYSLDLGIDKNLNTSMGTQHEFMLAYRFGRDNKKDDEWKEEIEKLKKKDQEIQDSLQSKVDSLGGAVEEAEKEAQDERDGMQENMDGMQKEADNLREKVITNEKEIERLKELLKERQITHKHIGEVFFEVGSDNLSDEIKTNLETLKRMLDEYPDNTVVYLYGNASVEGDSKDNMELAVRRGSKARQHLIELGFPAERIYVIPMGEYNPLDGDPSKQEKKDRRVDIMVHQED